GRASRPGNDFGCKDTFESSDIAALGCSNEGIEKTPSGRYTRVRVPAVGDVLSSARDDLPRVRLFNPKDLRDVAVSIIERFSEDVRGSFGRRQPFHQYPSPPLQRLPSLRALSRI